MCCTEKIQVPSSTCTDGDFSIECELKKTFIVVKPLKFEEGTRDLWENELDTADWYVLNKKYPDVLSPINTEFSCLQINGAVESCDLMYKYKDQGHLKFDTINPQSHDSLFVLSGITEMVVALSGEEVFTFYKEKLNRPKITLK